MPDNTDIPDDIRGLVAEKAQANAAGAAVVSPADAQGAIRNAPLSGVPAGVGMHSPEVGQQAADAARQQAVLASSPAVRSFVASDPAKAAATQNDWYSFGQIAKDFDTYAGPAWNEYLRHRTEQAQSPFGPITNLVQTPMDVFNVIGGGIGGAANAATGPIARHMAEVAPLTAVPRGDGLTTFGFGFTRAPGSRPATSEESASQYEAIPQGLAMSLPLPKFFPRTFRGPVEDLGLAREVPPEGPLPPGRGLPGPEGSVPPPQPITPPPEVRATVEPSPFTTEPVAPPGVNAHEAPFFEAEADTNAAVVKGLEERVAGTEIHASAPALVEDFLTNHTGMGDTPVWMNPQALVDLWQQGHTPFAGMVPQIQEALQTGRDVQVPLSTYLTETAGKPYADALREQTRFSEGGVSQEEAKTLGEGPTFSFNQEGSAFSVTEPGGEEIFARGNIGASGNLQITDSNLPERFRGQGHGTALYELLAQEAFKRGGELFSDYSLSSEAIRMYDALARRGYQVTRNPTAFEPTLKSVQLATEKANGPVFKVGPKPQVRIPEDLAPHEAEVRAIAAGVDSAVEQVFKAHGIEGLFAEAKAAGLTKPQFERYGEHIDALRADLRQRMLERTYAQLRRERTPAYKAQLDAIEPFQRQLIEQHPDVVAMRALGQTGMKLDRGAVEAFYPGAASRLPSSILKNNGNHPDAAADLLGYDSGAQLVNNLADLADGFGGKGLNAWVKAAAMDAARSQARTNLGYDPSPEGLLRTAREMLVESPMESYLTDDLKLLAKEAGLPFSRADVETFARQQFNAFPVREATNVRTFERGMWTTGEATQKALEKGDWAAAFKGRQAQLINYLQLRMAHDAAKAYRTTQRVLERWGAGDLVPGTSPEVGAILQAELNRIGQPVGRDIPELHRALETQRLEAQPYDIPTLNLAALNDGEVLDLVEGPGTQQDLRDLPWKQYVDYTNSLKGYHQYGAEKNSIKTAGRVWEMAEFTNEVVRAADAVGRKFTPQELLDIQLGTSNALANIYRGGRQAVKTLLTINLRPEVYLHWLDGGKQGPLMDLVNGLQQGKYTETDLSSAWKDAMKASVPSSYWDTANVRLVAPDSLDMTLPSGASVKVFQTRGNLRSALLYLGSPTAESRLMEGFGWNVAQQRFARQWLKANATKEDWDFARAFWDQNEKLFALADAKYRARRGYGIEKDEPQEVNTLHPEVGTISGGHVHVVYSSLLKTLSQSAGPVDGLAAAKTQYGTIRPGGDVLNPHPASRLPSAFYIEERTGAGPVDLDFKRLSVGVAEVIHDIAFRDPLIAAQKGLTAPTVRDAMMSVLGPEYEKQIAPWLAYIAQERMLYDPSTDALTRVVNTYRRNMSRGLLAWQLSSSVKHAMVGVSHMTGEVGPVAMTQAFSDLIGSGPKAEMWRKFVVDNSGEVRGLQFNVDANLSGLMESGLQGHSLVQLYDKYGYGLFTFFKYWEGSATWLAKYRTAIAENGNHAMSVNIADKAVRDTQGAGHAVDLAPILRKVDNAIGAALSIPAQFAMGFRSTSPNRLFTAKRQVGLGIRQLAGGQIPGMSEPPAGGRDVGAGVGNIAKAGVGVGAFVLGAALMLALYEVVVRGGGDPKAKTRTNAFEEELGWGTAENSVGSIVGVNRVFDAIKFGHGREDKLMADAKKVEQGHPERIHGAWREAFVIAGALGTGSPASVGNFVQALSDDDSVLQPSDRGAVPFLQRAILGRAPRYVHNSRGSR